MTGVSECSQQRGNLKDNRYKALSIGQTLKKAEFRFYKIDDSGKEKEYFKIILENVRVSSIATFMHDIKNGVFEKHTHHEYIDLSYEKITWHYIDGNIIHSDSLVERG